MSSRSLAATLGACPELVVDHVKQIESRRRFPVFITRWIHFEGGVEFVAVGNRYRGDPT